MAYFDFLIDKDNGKPNPDIEYIYLLDEVWIPNKLGGVPIIKGTIVTNVKQLDNRSYEFINKETGEILGTNYAWSLAENTPENILKIEKYNQEFKKFKEYEKQINKLRNEIVTLKPN